MLTKICESFVLHVVLNQVKNENIVKLGQIASSVVLVQGGGHWGTANTATPQKKITNTASPQKKLTKHRHRNLIFVLRFK